MSIFLVEVPISTACCISLWGTTSAGTGKNIEWHCGHCCWQAPSMLVTWTWMDYIPPGCARHTGYTHMLLNSSFLWCSEMRSAIILSGLLFMRASCQKLVDLLVSSFQAQRRGVSCVLWTGSSFCESATCWSQPRPTTLFSVPTPSEYASPTFSSHRQPRGPVLQFSSLIWFTFCRFFNNSYSTKKLLNMLWPQLFNDLCYLFT